MKLLITLSLLFLSHISFASNYDYNKLRFMDYNELRQIKNGAINASRKFQYPRQAEQTIKPLKETLTMLLSRPNSDNMVSPLLTDLESELETLNVYEKTLQEIIEERLAVIEDKKLSPAIRTTAALSINNLLLEIKPQSLKNPEIAKVICKMADRNIKLPKDIQESSMFRSLYIEKSPSSVAQKIMIWYAGQKNIKISAKAQSCPFSKRAI